MGFLEQAFRRPVPVTGDEALERTSAAHVTGNSRLKPSEQVDIYRRQFWLRHMDALEEDYPGVKYLIGEDAFIDFCRAYLLAHPPYHPSLRDLGADIVGFAERYADFPEASREAAIEMVRYENAFVEVFDGADAPPLDAQKIASMPEEAWNRARIVLHPLLFPLRFHYPVHHLRRAAVAGDDPLADAPAPILTHLALFRKDEMVRFEEIAPSAFDLLTALAAGEPLVGACERIAAALDPEAAAALEAEVGRWFQRWTAEAWIVDVEIPPGS